MHEDVFHQLPAKVKSDTEFCAGSAQDKGIGHVAHLCLVQGIQRFSERFIPSRKFCVHIA